MNDNELSNFLNRLGEINSFAAKVRLADEHFNRLGSGSARIVYSIDDNNILKLAKNPKGKAQNSEEVEVSSFDYNHDLVTKVFDYDKNDYDWIISEKAKKVTPKRIVELTGIPNLNDLNFYLRNYDSQMRGGREIFGIDEKSKEILDENEWVQDLLNLIVNHDQQVGDMGRPSSYGEVIRNGRPAIVLTDYGLSQEIYSTHYAPQRKGKMYEIIDMNRGGLYQDFTDGDEIRKSWWALQPYSVSNDIGYTNENFINLMENRNGFVIRKPIFNLMTLAEEFDKAVINLSEYIEKSPTPNKFINSLLALQEYLIENGAYDKDKILVEEDPPVKPFSLDKSKADEIAMKVVDEVGLSKPIYLNSGSYGFAYKVGDKVLKITTDSSEANSALIFKRINPKNIVDFYNIWKIVDDDASYFVILMEFIEDRPTDKFKKLFKIYLEALSLYGERQSNDKNVFVDNFFTVTKSKVPFDYNKHVNLAKEALYNNKKLGYDKTLIDDVYKFIIGILDVKKDLVDSGIVKGNDFLNFDNLGYKNGILTYFDVGGYKTETPTVPQSQVMKLDEEIVENSLDLAKKIVLKLKDRHNLLKVEYLGSGQFGDAYDVGNDMVMKITTDESEMMETLPLKGKHFKHIADIYGVYKIKKTNDDDKPLYTIILEKLDTDENKIKRNINRLEYVFKVMFDLDFYDIIDDIALGWSSEYNEKKDRIEKYFNKNKKDKEFFDSFVSLISEVRRNNIESIDYFSPGNLGYKKDGSLGFFDLGFVNPYKQQSIKPDIVKVDEDGTSKFSTDDYIGRDGFPTYNNITSQPPIGNDLNANDNLYEDRKKSYMPDSKKVEVKKKCRLGGLGNTSIACNQGDIENLEMTDIKETTNFNESKNDYKKVKDSLMRSKKIPKEKKELYVKYLSSGSRYDNGILFGLVKPEKFKDKSPHTDGISLGADKDGFFVYTHRAASKRYDTPEKISIKDIDFIETTG